MGGMIPSNNEKGHGKPQPCKIRSFPPKAETKVLVLCTCYSILSYQLSLLIGYFLS